MNCVVMKVLIHRSLSLDALRKNMRILWKPNKGVQISEGELALKEIILKWSPFWIQIFNLPLKSRIKEMGWEIDFKLGEVLEVDVPEIGVQ